MARKTSLGSLLVAGAAAYGLYRLSKLSAEERNGLVEKGKKLVTDNLGNLKNIFKGSHGNELTVKFIYFLDYNQLRKKR
jgi:hypothetical protein